MNAETEVHLICRVCGNYHRPTYLINIFGNYGKKQNLDFKIRLCLPIIVTVDDKMPRQVCLDCLDKLNATYEFYMDCNFAQHHIQKKSSLKRKSTSACINNMLTPVNSSSSNGQLLGKQLDGTSIMLPAASVPMMQAANSPMTDNPQGQLYVPSLSNLVNPAETMASPSTPVVLNPQYVSGPSAQMSTSCNKPQYPIQNNVPSLVQIMPVAQMQTGSFDLQSGSALAIYQNEHPSMPQNGVPLVQVMDNEGQMQMQPPPSSNVPMTRTPAGSGTQSGLLATTLYNYIPLPPHSMLVTPATNNATQMQPPRGWQPNRQNCPTLRTSLFTNPAMPQENGCATGPFQPVITQVTAGFQNAAAVQTAQETNILVDLSKDSDDDMDVKPRLDAPDESENKPFSLPIVKSSQRKTRRKRPTNSLAMEECPHCHKEFRADIIFHHVKLHFHQSLFSCLDCGRNYFSNKALEAHKCRGKLCK